MFYADFFILSKLLIKGVRISSNILAIKLPFGVQDGYIISHSSHKCNRKFT